MKTIPITRALMLVLIYCRLSAAGEPQKFSSPGFPPSQVDDQGRLAELETDPNPFALATTAHLLARATRKDPQGRLAGKLALTRRLYQRGWTKPEVLDLYEFIDWLLALPEALEDAFLDEIHDLEASTKMRYISSAERIGMKRGTQLAHLCQHPPDFPAFTMAYIFRMARLGTTFVKP